VALDKYNNWHEKDRGADGGHTVKKIVTGIVIKATTQAVAS
jgi:hypothetical protein